LSSTPIVFDVPGHRRSALVMVDLLYMSGMLGH
jgi:hypothetical protein